MVKKPVCVSAESPPADFEEDTLLPPPAPGLVRPELPAWSQDSLDAVEHAEWPMPSPEIPSLAEPETASSATVSDGEVAENHEAMSRVLAELPVIRTERISILGLGAATASTSEVHPTDAHVVVHEPCGLDPAATVEIAPVPLSHTMRFPAVLPSVPLPNPQPTNHETVKLAPVSPDLTQRFPTVARLNRVSTDSTPSVAANRVEQSPDATAQNPVVGPASFADTAEFAAAALRSAETLEVPVVISDSKDARHFSSGTKSIPRISLPPPSEDSLPPLPLLSSSDTFFGRISYAASGLRSVWRRNKQLGRLRRELADRIAAYERALIQLGELSYAEGVELAPFLVDNPKLASDLFDQKRLTQPATEQYVARVQKERRALARKQALLSSELRVLDRRRDDLYQRLLAVARDPNCSESSSDARYSIGNELSSLESERHNIAVRLGEARADLRLLHRHGHNIQARKRQLSYVLSLEHAASAGRAPHLLLLGAVTLRVQPPQTENKQARFEMLYSLLGALRAGICKVETRLAILDGERRSADQRTFFSTLWTLAAAALLAVTALGGLLYFLLNGSRWPG